VLSRGGVRLAGCVLLVASFELPKRGFAVSDSSTLGGPAQQGGPQGFFTRGWGTGPPTRDNIGIDLRSLFDAVFCLGKQWLASIAFFIAINSFYVFAMLCQGD
jgi:hypothetical protein